MGLCWGQKSNLRGRNLFPYTLAGKLSAHLWNHLLPNSVIVIFHIVLCKDYENVQFDGHNLTHYISDLENVGAQVIITEIENCQECVMTSKLIRMLSFNVPEVR